MPNPQLRIDLKKFKENAQNLAKLLREKGLKFHLVTKCFSAHEPLVRALAELDLRDFADSRLENFEVLNRYARTAMLIRLPMISEVQQVVRLADVSLNSELDTIRALSDAALDQGRKHGVVLMVELGDLREGALPQDLPSLAKQVLNLRGVRLCGIGANFNCYGGVIPDRNKMEAIAALARDLQQSHGLELDYVSGGNSGSLHLLTEGSLAAGVNHLRIGEGLLLGQETSYGRPLPHMHPDVFRLRCEVIECKLKPSLPDGDQGLNALGERPYFKDQGVIHRAILAIGAQDVATSGMTPLEAGVEFLGNSSDHAIYNVSGLSRELKTGDTLDFALNYRALNALFSSKYVHKTTL